MPDYVDWIVVVDEASEDGTMETVRSYLSETNERLHFIRHKVNQRMYGMTAA